MATLFPVVVNVTLNQTEVSVPEGSNATLCVVLTGDLDRSVNLIFRTAVPEVIIDAVLGKMSPAKPCLIWTLTFGPGSIVW